MGEAAIQEPGNVNITPRIANMGAMEMNAQPLPLLRTLAKVFTIRIKRKGAPREPIIMIAIANPPPEGRYAKPKPALWGAIAQELNAMKTSAQE